MTLTDRQQSRQGLAWIALSILLPTVLLLSSSLDPTKALAPESVPGLAQADLTLNKDAFPLHVTAGDLVTYTVTLENSGLVTGTVAAITDTLDANLSFAGMLPGDITDSPQVASNVLSWTGPFTVPPTADLALLYQVRTAGSFDAYQACNSVEIATQAAPLPSQVCVDVEGRTYRSFFPWAARDFAYGWLSVAKSVAPVAVVSAVDSEVVYTVTIVNEGDTGGTLQAITDTLPAGLTFLEMVIPGSDVTDPPAGTTGTIVWSVDWPMPPGERLDVIYRARANLPPGEHVNEVSVAADALTLPLQPATAILSADIPIAGLVAANDGPTIQGSPTLLTASVTAGSNVVYTWDLGDGTTGTGSSVSHVYPAVGTYVATVTARNSVSQATAATTVTVMPAVLLEENFNNTTVRLSRWTRFLNYSRLEEDQWVWEETDGVGGSPAATQNCWLGGDIVAHDALLMYLGPGAEEWTDYRVETKLLLRGGIDERDGKIVVVEEGGYPVGLWVRGQYEDVGDADPAGWVTGYYVIIGGKPTEPTMYVRLSQLQTLEDCWDAACDNPWNLYDFNNPHALYTAFLDQSFKRYTWYTLAVEVRGNNIKVFFQNQLVINFTDTKYPFLTGTIGFKTYKSKTASFDDVIVTPLH